MMTTPNPGEGRPVDLPMSNGSLPSSLVDMPTSSGSSLGYGAMDDEANAVSPLKRVHALMRGRYLIGLGIGVVLSIAFGITGYVIPSPSFMSQGLLEINNELPSAPNDDRVQTMDGGSFDDLVSAQMSLIGSFRVIEGAMSQNSWQQLGRPVSPTAINDFSQRLVVNRLGSGPVISIRFFDSDPRTSQVAVQNVMDFYLRLTREEEVRIRSRQANALEERRQSLQNQINNANREIRGKTAEFGTENLDPVYRTALSSQQRITETYDSLKNRLETEERRQRDAEERLGDGDSSEDAEFAGFTAEDAEPFDPEIRNLMRIQRNLEDRLSQALLDMGEAHEAVIALRHEIEIAKNNVDQRVQTLRRDPNFGIGEDGEPQVRFGEISLSVLRVEVDGLEENLAIAKQETVRVGALMAEIERLRAEREKDQEELEDILRRQQRLAAINADSQARVEILSSALLPVEASNDAQIKQLAVLGAVTGLFGGFALIALYGAFERRLRYSMDATLAVEGARILGMLPTLPEDLADPAQMRLAAYSVHHIRMMLQVDAEQAQHKVYAITSPTAGCGKTSLAVALGMSFASSGSKTLLIDTDFETGAISERFEAIARRRLGQILVTSGKITQEQLDEAIAKAADGQRKIGEVLIELGYVQSSDIDFALTAQLDSRLGFIDALRGGTVSECIVDTGVDDLSILPIGSVNPEDSGRFNLEDIRRVIREARNTFDAVILDCGPLPGNVGANMVASASDGSILMVSKGDRSPQLQASIEMLESTKANILGLVFNRADIADIQSTQSIGNYAARGSQAEAQSPRRFGPMGSALAGKGSE